MTKKPNKAKPMSVIFFWLWLCVYFALGIMVGHFACPKVIIKKEHIDLKPGVSGIPYMVYNTSQTITMVDWKSKSQRAWKVLKDHRNAVGAERAFRILSQ